MVFQAVLSGIIARFFITEIIREVWFRARPFVENSVNMLIPYSAKESSFPSGHASIYFAISTIIYLYNKKLGIGFLVASFLICLSRIFVGIHWPSDILAGIVVGIGTALIVHKLFLKIKK
jgi:undecaprenyl-diphosphatase